MASKVQPMLESRSRPISTPFTLTVHQRSRKPSASRYGSSSSAVTIHGPRRGREVLALGRAEADLHLAALDVAGRPVVHDRVAEDVSAASLAAAARCRPADDDGDLELEVTSPARQPGSATSSSGPMIACGLVK